MITAAKPCCLSATAFPKFELNDDVLLLVETDNARLLDFQRGRFYGLDRIATALVTETLTGDARTAVEQVAKRFDVSTAEIEQDLAELLHQLSSKRLLRVQQREPAVRASSVPFLPKIISMVDRLRGITQRGTQFASHKRDVSSRRSRPRTPSRFEIQCLLTAAWMSLRVLGFTRTLRLWKRWHCTPVKLSGSVDSTWVREIDQAVQSLADSRLLLPAVCKERALVTYQLLRAYAGLPAEIVIGVEYHPFLAHAWVECDGQIFSDQSERCEPFIPVARFL